jgi:hypothetical protein
MRTITATRPRSLRLRGDQYQCGRCGRIAKFNTVRGRPELCGDCKEIETTLTETEPTP